jgi:hypothetical protein
MNLIRKILFLTVAIVLLLAAESFSDAAENEHGHNTPHGGVVQQAEGMQVEFLVDKNGEPRVYLYDQAMKTLERSDIRAKLTVAGHDGVQHERDLKFVKDSKEGPLFKGEPIRGLTHWHAAVVSVKSKDQWSHIRFSNH